MTEPDPLPFGAQLYEALLRQGLRSLVTGRLDYAQVQALKAGGRAEVAALFHGTSRRIAARIESDPPEILAAYLAGFRDGGNLGDKESILLAGALWI